MGGMARTTSMKEGDEAERSRRIRLGLIPSRNPYIGRVTVYSDQTLELPKLPNVRKSNVAWAQESQSARRNFQESLLTPQKVNRLKIREKRRLQIEQFFEQQQTNREQAARRSKETRQQKLAQLDKKFGDMLSNAIGRSRSIDSIEKYLDAKDAAETEKNQRLCNAWNTLVFRKIQDQIIENINDGKTLKRIRMRNQLYTQYLETSNKSKRVFLDLICPENYDPFKWTKLETKYKTSGIWDPLKRDLLKHKSETKCSAGLH